MSTDVKFILFDVGLTPNTIEVNILASSVSGNADRDIKIFDIGVMAFMVEDILAGYKLPNFITDWGRQKEKIVVKSELIEGLHDPIEQELWILRRRFLLDSFRYVTNKLEIGDYMKTDNITSEGAGTGPLYCRVKNFSWEMLATEFGSITYSVEFWIGKIKRIMD